MPTVHLDDLEDPTLRRAFHSLNKQWFGSKLPLPFLNWHKMKDMGEFFLFTDGTSLIRINDKLRQWRTAWESTLLHEMIHLATTEEPEPHGPKWLALRRKLMRKGAFEKYL